MISMKSHRLPALDATRGLIMLLMLVDHTRETFYLHHNLQDPMDVTHTEPALFITRLLTHLCAPLFVFLAGTSAWLYDERCANKQGELTRYLLTRGLILIALEITVINFAWVMRWPTVIYLQVIWAIGISMLALAILCKLSLRWQVTISVIIIAGHNLLDGIVLPMDQTSQWLWAVLHQRAMLPLFDELSVRTSYPVLPWIGLMLLGFASAQWYARCDSVLRHQRLLQASLALLLGFVVLRFVNVYGDLHPRESFSDAALTVMSFFNVTKYPPSLLFVSLTLGIGMLLLRAMDRDSNANPGWYGTLLVFGRVPLFFYVLHLYVVHGVHALLLHWLGPNQGALFGVSAFWSIWPLALVFAALLYWPCTVYARHKQRHPNSVLRFF
jgi:uncharacterized membrane protein